MELLSILKHSFIVASLRSAVIIAGLLFAFNAHAETVYQSPEGDENFHMDFTNGPAPLGAEDLYVSRIKFIEDKSFTHMQMRVAPTSTYPLRVYIGIYVDTLGNNLSCSDNTCVTDDTAFRDTADMFTGTYTSSSTIDFDLSAGISYPGTTTIDVSAQQYLMLVIDPNNVPTSQVIDIVGQQGESNSTLESGFADVRRRASYEFKLCAGPCTTTVYEPVYTEPTLEDPDTTCADATTRIVDFNPQEGALVGSPVNFDLTACIHPDDLGVIQGVNVTLHNIDQNVILLDFLSPSDIYLIRERDIETPGIFYFSTSTPIGDGNYRLEACIQRAYFGGFIINPFADITDCESHQFTVNQGTFIGTISQSIFGDTNDFFEDLTSTSSEALANTCNPLGGNFGIRECSAFLFIPDASSMRETMELMKEGILTRWPWGYATRFVNILSSAPTSSLPSFSHTFQYGAGSDMTPNTTTLTFDVGDMIAGGGAIMNNVTDPIYGKTLREAAEPIIQFGFGAVIILIITLDIMGMASAGRQERNGQSREGGKLS